jgi:hypothetical protein
MHVMKVGQSNPSSLLDAMLRIVQICHFNICMMGHDASRLSDTCLHDHDEAPCLATAGAADGV